MNWPIDYIKEKNREGLRILADKKPYEIWVTELLMCPLKSFFNKELTIEMDGVVISPLFAEELDSPSLVLGDLVHRGLEQWLQEKYGCETEVEVSREIEIGGTKYTIKGRIDALCGDTVIEIKYVRDIKSNQPFSHHVRQLQIYMWMTNRIRGKILYVSPARLLEYEVKSPVNEPQVAMMVEEYLIKPHNLTPRYDWECRYCPFQSICPRYMPQVKK